MFSFQTRIKEGFNMTIFSNKDKFGLSRTKASSSGYPTSDLLEEKCKLLGIK